MNFGEFLAEVLKRSAVALGLTAAGATMEAGSDSLAQRFPEALRLTRLVGGALFVLGGLFWATADTVMFILAWVGSSWTFAFEVQGAGDVAFLLFIWLVDVAMALIAVVLGLRWMIRGWAA